MLQEQSNDSLLELFIFETSQNLEQLEQIVLNNEQLNEYTPEAINEIFRIMHTIKGSAAMMMFQNISSLAHHVEDMFSFIREQSGLRCTYSEVSDLVLECVDFFKEELEKIKAGATSDGDATALMDRISKQLVTLKEENAVSTDKNESVHVASKPPVPVQQNHNDGGSNSYQAHILFEDGCQMESLRAYNMVHMLEEFAKEVSYFPEDIAENDNSTELIRKEGFTIYFSTDKSHDEMHGILENMLFVKELKLNDAKAETVSSKTSSNEKEAAAGAAHPSGKEGLTLQGAHTSSAPIISVNVTKLDKLMDLISEMVITQEMVVRNPELSGLKLDNFQKSAQQLKKITGELREVIMSIRMVPLTMTFQKTNRIVRDMSKKLGKNIHLQMIGEEIEVDKNIIEHISDPLMHLIRNSMDHGIESAEERKKAGKPEQGTITLEARNESNEILVIVSDDGKGLNRELILKSAQKKGIHTKPPEEMSDRDVFSLIFLPGFSTKEQVSEFSGRGVGMDVVVNNIEAIGGRISVESVFGKGTDMIMRFPTTLSIIDGMNIRVGSSLYTLAITNIIESFRPKSTDIIKSPEGSEMIMVRGNCYQIIRLHKIFNVKPDSTAISDGVLIMVEAMERTICLYADELLGQQEVVVKSLPNYLKKIRGLAGCTLLGNGEISLILDAAGIMRI